MFRTTIPEVSGMMNSCGDVNCVQERNSTFPVFTTNTQAIRYKHIRSLPQLTKTALNCTRQKTLYFSPSSVKIYISVILFIGRVTKKNLGEVHGYWIHLPANYSEQKHSSLGQTNGNFYFLFLHKLNIGRLLKLLLDTQYVSTVIAHYHWKYFFAQKQILFLS